VRQRIGQTVDALMATLTARRHYADGLSYDPRFLVFEFINNIVMRDAQVEMIRAVRTTECACWSPRRGRRGRGRTSDCEGGKEGGIPIK